MSAGSRTTIRINEDWCNLNPAPGQYDWTQLDQWYLDNPAFAGADFIYTFLNPPGWPVGQSGGCLSSATYVENAPPTESAWTSFISALVQHANGRIKYFELWNEWDYSGFWAGTTSNNGGSWPEIEAPGQQSIYDWVAKVRRIMQTDGYQNYLLWSTEGSWGLNSGFPNYSDPASQRAYVARYDLALLSLGVSRSVWYAYSNPSWAPLWTPPSSTTAGGLTPAGIATNELEKPGGWLTGATLTAPCSHDSSTQALWTCNITRPNGYTGRILWVQSGTRVLKTPPGFKALRTLSGTSSRVPGQLTIGIEPILIQSTGVSATTVKITRRAYRSHRRARRLCARSRHKPVGVARVAASPHRCKSAT